MTKKEVIKYLKNNKMDIQSAHAAMSICDLVFSSYVSSYLVHRTNFSPVFCYISYKHLDHFYQMISERNIERVIRKIYSDYLKNEKTLLNKIKRHKDLEIKIDKVWQGYQKKREKLTDRELLKIFRKLVKLSREWWHYAAIGEDKGKIIDTEIVPKFARTHKLSIDRAKEIIYSLYLPEEQSVFNQERKDFLKLCFQYLKNKKVEGKVMKDYIKRYFWFKSDFYKASEITPQSLLKEVTNEIKKKKKTEILEELKGIDENFRKIKKQKEKILKNIKLSKEDKKNIKFAQLTTLWMDHRKLGMMKDFYYFFSIVNDIVEKFNLNYDDFVLYTVKEIDDFLAKEKKINQKEIKNRNEGIFLVYERNYKITMFYGKEGKELFKIATFVKKEKEIKGQVASTGGVNKVRGRVRIVFRPAKDIFKAGEILVTSMTRVEFVPLMRKAKAIITNEGGVACHAAIVSRELNIPCIIGTKIATKALKDGDMIEVDANKGLIKILKNE